ncbi:MAG: DNA polymerase III subunit beta [Candidatus Doudnabacteria bacterium RIFCSPLOWO2_02_FULL_49_13]|nr:MAG: DNA polymerase III subunit beta [Candidatus Doudnabacteria bacterium RIFCSPHIGHO2_02_FULL_49_24]OGE88540.1 MAG: DNA polymerase III subunit beta [Candidatus Doudnabacteria bacterium RIFCSPHIGHO2_01_FULL_50_67]OGF02344.1 MAG: DNA polymerase III subunit beta [Candidatus Doudnabacteria bacterium RIFCSPLOWO2_02_FULL_49_13]
MKITCTRDNLKKGLFAVSRIVGSGNPLQVLNNILIKTDEGRVKLSSTNLEIGVNTWVGGKIEEEGAITVPARIINEYINNLPTEKVEIETTENNTLKLESENYHTSIKGLSSEDFPLIPQVTEEPLAKIDSQELKNALSETAWAAAANETQPEISGVFMAFENDRVRIATTDRYRLAERTATLLEPARSQKEVIIPARTVGELYKILGLGKGVVEIYFSESQVLFKFDDTELISRLIDGQYPDYRQIIPKEFKTMVEVPREDLLHALKATALFAPDSNNITIEVRPDSGLTVTASSMAAGENTTQVKAKVTGGDNSAVFNFRYLLDCLNNLSEEGVIFKMINDSSPAAIVPIKRDNYLYIVMPIKL